MRLVDVEGVDQSEGLQGDGDELEQLPGRPGPAAVAQQHHGVGVRLVHQIAELVHERRHRLGRGHVPGGEVDPRKMDLREIESRGEPDPPRTDEQQDQRLAGTEPQQVRDEAQQVTGTRNLYANGWGDGASDGWCHDQNLRG
jgi:hypothetical protein